MSISYSFAGKRVLITGGGQGIGRALIQRFHDGGAIVFTVDKNAESVSKLLEELPSVTAKVVDLTNWEETKAVVNSFGAIDHLVNNAGIVLFQPFMGVTEAAAMQMYSVHIGAIFNVSQVVAQGMIERGTGGSIVNISSIAARVASEGTATYGSVKAAMENLTKSMALELGQNNIRVNCILPAMVNAPMAQTHDMPPELIQKVTAILDKMLGKRAIEPNEIADLVLFLLSPLASMITAQGVVIDGGMLAS